MDSLDKVTATTSLNRPEGEFGDFLDEHLDEETAAKAEAVVDEAVEVVRTVNWWKVAGYTAAGLAVAIGGYAYWRAQQRKPVSRLERIRDHLGLSDVDFRHLRSTYNKIDFDKLNATRRDLGTMAKKATHVGAKKVAAWTR